MGKRHGNLKAVKIHTVSANIVSIFVMLIVLTLTKCVDLFWSAEWPTDPKEPVLWWLFCVTVVYIGLLVWVGLRLASINAKVHSVSKGLEQLIYDVDIATAVVAKIQASLAPRPMTISEALRQKPGYPSRG
jgi:hypothetical protein